ncbi:subtilisin-like protein [Apiospora hydei]|uniref:Subtilisin-like protein n=1 Tax=Apiospora hydei TaxID=1337664 RepID=A0ABR1VJ49_9PEZI
MHALAIKSALATLVLGVACATPPPGTPEQAAVDSGPEISKQYIVEYMKGASVARDLSNKALKVIKSYDSALFTGAAVELGSEDDVASYAAAPHIANIWPNRKVRLEQPVDRQSFSDDVQAVEYTTHRATGVDKLHKSGVLGQGVKVGVVDTGVWYKHPALGGGFGPGFKVEGGWDFVGDVDIDFDTKQPDADPISLPDIGHGTHVAGIVAAVSENFVGVAPNATIYAYKVTGNAEGSDDATLIDAFLRAEKDGMDVITASISSSAGWADAAWAVVVSRVVEAGVIVTVSASNKGDNGAFMGIAAGSSPGSLAVASVQAALAPAAPYKLTYTVDGASTTTISGYVGDDTFPATVKDWPIFEVVSSNPDVDPGCEAFPADTPKRSNSVALVPRSPGCNWSVKQKNLLAIGVEYVLFYNDGRVMVPPTNTLPQSTLGVITAEAGAAILKALRANATVTADFSYTGGEVGVPDPIGNTPNTFSGWAATYDLQLKPDIAAPGGNIFSTWSDNKYMVQSGTSMSTPYIAGIAALYVGVFGGRKERGAEVAQDFHRRVVASGSSMSWADKTATNPDFVAPPVQMGSGLVDAVRTLYANTTVDNTRLHLNDTANFQPTHDLAITNHGREEVTYDFTLEPAAGFEILDPYIAMWGTWGIKKFDDLVPMKMVPDVQLPEAVTVRLERPGRSRKSRIFVQTLSVAEHANPFQSSVTFANPENKGWNATTLPLYSGKVKITGSNGERLSVQYMGVASSLYENKRVWQKTYPTCLGGVNWKNIDVDSTYVIPLLMGLSFIEADRARVYRYNFNSKAEAFNYPALSSMFDWGVHELRWDIFESDWDESKWTYPPTAADGFVGATARWTGTKENAASLDLTDPAVVKANTVETPIMSLSRNGFASRDSYTHRWVGHLANGTIVAPGNYTVMTDRGKMNSMRVAASRPFGDLSKLEGWEVWRREITVVA